MARERLTGPGGVLAPTEVLDYVVGTSSATSDDPTPVAVIHVPREFESA